jgi:hypothetical protein
LAVTVVSLIWRGDTRRRQGCSSDCQVQGERDLANYFRPLPDDYWAVSPLGAGMSSYSRILPA